MTEAQSVRKVIHLPLRDFAGTFLKAACRLIQIIIMKILYGKFGNESGQSIVETALVLPLLLLILCAILDFGWIFANTYRAEYAAGTAARYASMNAASMTEEQLTAAVTEKVLENVWTGEDATTVTLAGDADGVTVQVLCSVRTLTFVADTLFGHFYEAAGSVTAAY